MCVCVHLCMHVQVVDDIFRARTFPSLSHLVHLNAEACAKRLAVVHGTNARETGSKKRRQDPNRVGDTGSGRGETMQREVLLTPVQDSCFSDEGAARLLQEFATSSAQGASCRRGRGAATKRLPRQADLRSHSAGHQGPHTAPQAEAGFEDRANNRLLSACLPSESAPADKKASDSTVLKSVCNICHNVCELCTHVCANVCIQVCVCRCVCVGGRVLACRGVRMYACTIIFLHTCVVFDLLVCMRSRVSLPPPSLFLSRPFLYMILVPQSDC